MTIDGMDFEEFHALVAEWAAEQECDDEI